MSRIEPKMGIINQQTVHQWLRNLVWTRPALYRFVAAARRRREFYTSAFDICIAGFPRSANSYCARMLEITQSGIKVMSHRHHPAIAIHAIRLGKPVLLLLRNPEDAIPSQCIHSNRPDRSIGWFADYYIAFHRALLPYASRMFLATFEDVTHDFKTVLRGFNARYSLNLVTDFDEAAAREEAFRRIERAVTQPDGTVNYRKLNIPTSKRHLEKAKLQEQLRAPELRSSLDEAQRLYMLHMERAREQRVLHSREAH